MNGELILKKTKKWKKILPSVAVTALVTFLFIMLLVRRMEAGTLMVGIMAALVTYILFRTLYPTLSGLFDGGEKAVTVPWSYSGAALQLGEETIAMEHVKMVHCWPNRDALGHTLPGWIVNIEGEKGHKNHILYSLDEGDRVEASVETLHELVIALGYKDSWTEE